MSVLRSKMPIRLWETIHHIYYCMYILYIVKGRWSNVFHLNTTTFYYYIEGVMLLVVCMKQLPTSSSRL